MKLLLARPVCVDKMRFLPGCFDEKSKDRYNRIKLLGVKTENGEWAFSFRNVMQEQVKILPQEVTFCEISFTIRVAGNSNRTTALAGVTFWYKNRKIELIPAE